jgi:ABC-type branched-subunit amino acid transport system substrate-binding protein
MTEQYKQCIGVTDGSYVFVPSLRTVEGDIRAENQWVLEHGPYVTVALLAPLTPSTDVSIARIRYWLEGAYTAQYRANHDNVFGDNPRIRLVLANEGNNDDNTEPGWSAAVTQIKRMTGAPDHLVTVIGMGISFPQTQQGASTLSADGIPMVGAVISADGLDSTKIPGLFRVNPYNSVQLTALARYLPRVPGLRTAMLVDDTDKADLYTLTLASDFRSELGRYIVAGRFPHEPFDDARRTDRQFATIARNFCGSRPPDMIFYAGRAALLPDFIKRLRERACEKTRTITVVTGSDADGLSTRLPAPAPHDAPVQVIYSALAVPGELADPRWNPGTGHADYQRFLAAFDGRGFAPPDLADGWAIMAHDAMLAAAAAIQQPSGTSPILPTAADAWNELPLLNTPQNSVPGAAGTFELDPDSGDPFGRPFPVMELRPDGSLLVRLLSQPPAPTAGH